MIQPGESLAPVLGQTGKGFSVKDIITGGSFSEEAAAFGNRLFSENQSGTDTLLALIYSHSLTPQTDQGITYLLMRVSFFAGGADSFRYLYTADSFYEAYTSKHEDTWRTMLNITWLNNFRRAASLASSGTAERYTIREAFNRPETIKRRLPVYNTDRYPTGIYFTRAEFLNLKPGLTAFKEWDNGETNAYPHSYYRLLENGQRGQQIDEQDYYAVFNGKRWYKAGQSGLYQMHFIDGDFYFTAPMDGLKGKEAATMQTGALASLLSAGITAISNEARVKNNKTTVVKRKVRLDAETGRYIP